MPRVFIFHEGDERHQPDGKVTPSLKP